MMLLPGGVMRVNDYVNDIMVATNQRINLTWRPDWGPEIAYTLEVAMQNIARVFLAILSVGVALPIGTSAATAQNPGPQESIALKGGETVELGNLFWVVNCRSLLNGPPVAEVLEGPPEVTAAVRAQNVIPRKLNCAKEVPGGMLVVTAPKEIKARTQGIVTIRIKYPTKDGERQATRQLNVTLIP